MGHQIPKKKKNKRFWSGTRIWNSSDIPVGSSKTRVVKVFSTDPWKCARVFLWLQSLNGEGRSVHLISTDNGEASVMVSSMLAMNQHSNVWLWLSRAIGVLWGMRNMGCLSVPDHPGACPGIQSLPNVSSSWRALEPLCSASVKDRSRKLHPGLFPRWVPWILWLQHVTSPAGELRTAESRLGDEWADPEGVSSFRRRRGNRELPFPHLL